MKINISIIIPFHNVEKYFENCLKSVLRHTRQDMEVLLIDDCSTDGSLALALRVANEDKRVRIIANQTSKGAGGARNVGVVQAQGAYIWFVDSDDTIEQGSIDRLYDCATLYDSDIILFDYFYCDHVTKFKRQTIHILDDKDIDHDFLQGDNTFVFEAKIDTNKMLVSQAKRWTAAWMFVFKKNFLQTNNFLFLENCIYEDNVLLLLQSKANKLVYLREQLYTYYSRLGSSINTKIVPDLYLHNIKNMVQCANFFDSDIDSYQKILVASRIFRLLIVDRNAFTKLDKDQSTIAIQRAIEIWLQARNQLHFDLTVVATALQAVCGSLKQKYIQNFANLFCNDNTTPTQICVATQKILHKKQHRLTKFIKGSVLGEKRNIDNK